MEQEKSFISEEETITPEVSENNETPENTLPQPLPEINFSALSTEEIVRQAQKLIDGYPVAAIKIQWKACRKYLKPGINQNTKKHWKIHS